MGLQEWLFFRNWPRPRQGGGPPDLNLDIAKRTLGIFKEDTLVETLKERLGPPVSWSRMRHQRQWVYPDLGVIFESECGLIVEYLVVTRQPELSPLRKWQGLWQAWSGSIAFPDGFRRQGLEIRLDDFLKHLEEPTDRDDEDGEGTTLVYSLTKQLPDIDLEVEFTPEGELRNLDISW